LGLALQVHHIYYSKILIEILHSHGLCASYHEVRQYLTSVAYHEIKKIEQGSYLPHRIISTNGETNLIQEGADNVDINTETIDGKDTFHSMARAVFQVQSSSDRPTVDPIKRSADRSLHITEASSNIIWVLLSFFSRNFIELAISIQLVTDQQIIPFWTGYFRLTSKNSPSLSKIVDARPTDMTTVYTTMKRCVEMCTKAGQQDSIETLDQQLYAITKQVQWSNPEEFKYHILRRGGFHTFSSFIACIGKLWSDGGLSDLLVESWIYASCTL